MGRRPVLAPIVLTAVAAARAWSWPAMVGPALSPAVDARATWSSLAWAASSSSPGPAGRRSGTRRSPRRTASPWSTRSTRTRRVTSPSTGTVTCGGGTRPERRHRRRLGRRQARKRRWKRALAHDGRAGADFDEPAAVAVDASGNVATAGVLIDATAQWRFGVVKLAGADGAELWHPSFDDPDGGAVRAVAVTTGGDVVAAGGFAAPPGGVDRRPRRSPSAAPQRRSRASVRACPSRRPQAASSWSTPARSATRSRRSSAT